jgi:uncharacterized coiled-coil protein SlyX
MRRIFLRSLALFLAVYALSCVRVSAQQDENTSVAEAARRARQQKQDAAKPARVIDNDVIPPASPEAVKPAADAAAPAAQPGATTADANAAKKSDASPAEDASKKKEIEDLKQQIAEKKQTINLDQRELALLQDTYLSNPDHTHDTAGKEKLDSMQSDIAQAQSELELLVAKLAGMSPASDATTENPPAAPNAPASTEKPATTEAPAKP